MTYTIKTLPPEWRDTNLWPSIDLSQLDKIERERFDRLAAGLMLYLRSGSRSAAAKAAGCSGTSLVRLLNRCVQVSADGCITGWAGLIAHRRVVAYTRRIPLPTGPRAGEGGGAGAFARLLTQHSDIRQLLDDAIDKGIGRGAVRGQLPSAKVIFALFKRWCEKHLSSDDYPLNSKTKGRRSLERYVKEAIAARPRAKDTWFGQTAASGLRVGTGVKSFDFGQLPFDLVGLDAHKLHAVGIVVVNGPAGPQKVPIERLWIYTAVDVATRAILGYSVAIRTEPTAAHLEEALSSALTPWKPRDLRIAGMSYRRGAGLPCGSIEGLLSCRPVALRIDNAAQHFAHRIIHGVRRRLGCVVSWGPVGAWWANAITERVFGILELHGFQRLPSSMGSNALDPQRRDPVRQAIAHAIEWQELVDLVDVSVANYNAEPQRGLGQRSPLDVMRAYLDAEPPTLLPRVGVPPTVTAPALGISVENKFVRGTCKKGRIVRPYVQVDGVRYSNPVLSSRFDLIGQSLVVHVQENDMREMGAFLNDGNDIGALCALDRGWQKSPHNRDMRKQINRLVNDGQLLSDSEDLVAMYLEYLSAKAHVEAKARPGKVSRTATVLAEAAHTSGLPLPTGINPKLHEVVIPIRPSLANVPSPSWRKSK